MLTVHHLHTSQSERIVWLCEELGLDYRLKCYDRDPVTRLGQSDYKALFPMGTAPVIDDDDVRLGESGAIVEYLINRHGGGRLALAPTDPDYPRYLYWLHFANGTLQPVMGRAMILRRLEVPAADPVLVGTQKRLELTLQVIEDRLGEVPYLAGEAFSAADIMTVFSLTTMRAFQPLDLGPWPNIRAYLARIGERSAYRRAMQKGDPAMTPRLT